MLSGGQLAQQWRSTSPAGSAGVTLRVQKTTLRRCRVVFTPGFAIGAALDKNMYKCVGGQLRCTFRNGSPELLSHGLVATGRGYTNVVPYELLVCAMPNLRADRGLRPVTCRTSG